MTSIEIARFTANNMRISLDHFRGAFFYTLFFMLVQITLPRAVLAETDIQISYPNVTWNQERVMASVAKIVSQTCFSGSCPDLSVDDSARVGTGFVVDIPGYGKVIATALHNIAGARRITYQFTTRESSKPERTAAVVVSLNDDVALLQLTKSDHENVAPLTLATSKGERDELLSLDLGFISYGHGLASAYLRPQSGKVNAPLEGTLKTLLDVNGGRFAMESIQKAGYPSLDKVNFIAILDALLPGDSGGPILHQQRAIVIGMSHGAIPISQGKIEWMVPSERIVGISDLGIDPLKLPIFGPQDVFYSTSLFFSDGARKSTPLKTTPSLRFNIQIPKNAPFLFEYLSRVSHWARVPEIRQTWKDLPRSKLNRSSNRVNRTSIFYPGHKDAVSTCGWELKPDTCKDLVNAEVRLSSLLDDLTLEIECFDQWTFNRITSDGSFKRPNQLLRLEMDLGPIGDRVEFSVDYGTNFVSLNSKGYVDYVPGRGNYTHVDLKNVEQLFGGACRLTFGDNGNKGSEWWPLYRAFGEAMKRSGSVCVELSLSDTVLMPLFYTEYASLGAEAFEGGSLWGLLPLSDIEASSDDVYCQ